MPATLLTSPCNVKGKVLDMKVVGSKYSQPYELMGRAKFHDTQDICRRLQHIKPPQIPASKGIIG